MTKPQYLKGSAAGSEVRGVAASPAANSPADYAWNVNFNNGNANWNNHNNSGFVRAVRPSEYQDAVAFRALHAAWREARRGKRPSQNQLDFDTRWLDGLLNLQRRLNAGTWSPARPTCFVAKRPKAREIHAPDFADRVVHHWLVPQLEAIYEPGFIFDCFSNRKGKGTHAAVDRLRSFIRQVQSGQACGPQACSPQGGGWYLQLDIHNFFNSIHRPTLYAMLKRRMDRAGLRPAVRRTTHALLRHSPTGAGVHFTCTAAERALVPAHKRLENARPGCGIPIGNLSSQFFANVYLDALDQFVKHELKAPRYLRYVDDFVLVHQSREQLEAWRTAIATFLVERLRLNLKSDVKLKPLQSGIDFLGYVVWSTHTVVRRRVVHHACEKLTSWAHRHVRGRRIQASPSARAALQSTWASYCGHFSHANTTRLRRRIEQRFPWLQKCVA